jgi:hypothetical protein
MLSNEEFEIWLQRTSDRLEYLFTTVPERVQNQLAFSLQSLDVLEKWLLDKYPDLETARDMNEYPLIDAVGTYVGETFRKQFGGKWTIELEDQENAYLVIPGITGFRSIRVPPIAYPRTWVTASIDRRVGNFIRGQTERYLR